MNNQKQTLHIWESSIGKYLRMKIRQGKYGKNDWIFSVKAGSR